MKTCRLFRLGADAVDVGMTKLVMAEGKSK